MSYGIIFLIGLMASVSSCMATAGGLLVGMTATADAQQMASARHQKIKTSAFFNIGRVLSYTIFGALIGALGSALTLSPRVGGIITIVASVVMVLLGIQLLNFFPWTRFLQPRMPQFLVHGLYDFSQKRSNVAPFLVGAATFFLPCGFTQALQFYVLSQKSAALGALTMLVFSLGTAPALLSLSGLASVFTGKAQLYVMKVAGVLVLVIGLVSLNSGLSIAGVSLPNPTAFLAQLGTGNQGQTGSVVARITDGKQHVSMKISYLTYNPSNITLVQGIPVEWRIDASEAKGCARVLVIPDLGLTFDLSEPEQTIRFVPKDVGRFRFMCSMGMTTPGAALTVVSHLPTETAVPPSPTETVTPNPQKALP
jgi:sulfite exporter TauE/SafE